MTVDIAAFQIGQPYIAALVTAVIPGRRISGSEKLAQRFLLELTTVLGSIPFSDRGTNFMVSLHGGSIFTEADIYTSFQLALEVIRTNLQSEEKDTDPLDEKFSNAVLTQIILQPGEIHFKILVHSAANLTSTITFPVEFNLIPAIVTGSLD